MLDALRAACYSCKGADARKGGGGAGGCCYGRNASCQGTSQRDTPGRENKKGGKEGFGETGKNPDLETWTLTPWKLTCHLEWYTILTRTRHLFLEHFVPLASKYKDRPKDKEVYDTVKAESGNLARWGYDLANFTFTGYSPSDPKLKTLVPMQVRRMVARMFVSLHLHELQMVGHPRFEKGDEDYFPTPIPSAQFDVQFLMTGEEAKDIWKEEWYGAIRKDPKKGDTFEVGMAQAFFKDEVYPMVANVFLKAVRTK
eukprot:g20207.t1